MERGIPDKGPGGWGRRDGGTPRRDRGFVPDCLFAGNRGWIKASRFASRFSTSFCRISIAIGHDSGRTCEPPPRLIRVKESRIVATFVPFVQPTFISALHIPRENQSLLPSSSNIIPLLSFFLSFLFFLSLHYNPSF